MFHHSNPDNSKYAGQSGTKYLYVPTSDQGITSWNNGNPGYSKSYATDKYNGKTNSTKLTTEPIISNIDAPYEAVNLCRDLNDENDGSGTSYDGKDASDPTKVYHNDWYLPSTYEAKLLCTSKDIGAFAGTFGGGNLWASTEYSTTNARDICLDSCGIYSRAKSYNYTVRCVRRSY